MIRDRLTRGLRSVFPTNDLRRRWWIGAGVLGIVVVGLAGWVWLSGAEARNLAVARAFAATGQLRRAQLLYEQAVQIRPGSVRAQLALAEFLENWGAPQAVERWRIVVALEPNNDHRWRLAAAALRNGDLPTASEALAAVTAPGREQLEHHRLAAGLALARGDRVRAEAHLEAMVGIEPANERYRFALAAHRLANDSQAAAARRELEGLARQGALRVRATLELVGDAPRRWPQAADPEALLAARLFDAPGGSVQLRAASRSGRARLVAHLKAKPFPEPADAAVLVTWFLREERAGEALEWLRDLPEDSRHHPALIGPTAECAVRAHDWEILHDALGQGAWGIVARPVLDQAFALHAAPARDGNRAARWQALLEDAARAPASLRVLWRLAEAWSWPAEAERALSVIVRRHPEERWAWETLQATLLRRGDSAALSRHYAAWVRERPDDVPAQAAQLLVGFLTGRADAAMRQRAVDLHARFPANPTAAAIHALELRERGRSAEAWACLEPFGAEALQAPRLALVRGLLLAEAGRKTEAVRALTTVAEPLLPEERVLLARAQALAAPRTP